MLKVGHTIAFTDNDLPILGHQNRAAELTGTYQVIEIGINLGGHVFPIRLR
jgi:hypothetical protein